MDDENPLKEVPQPNTLKTEVTDSKENLKGGNFENGRKK